MKLMSRLLVVALLIGVLLVSMGPTNKEEGSAAKEVKKEEVQVRDGVFVHISKGVDNKHEVLMALQMANLMADSRDVLVYLDIKGIEVVLKNAPDLKMEPFPSSKEALMMLMDKKVTVMACPGCLKAAGKTAEDLMEGIQVADKDAFFNFTKGRILTLDY